MTLTTIADVLSLVVVGIYAVVLLFVALLPAHIIVAAYEKTLDKWTTEGLAGARLGWLLRGSLLVYATWRLWA